MKVKVKNNGTTCNVMNKKSLVDKLNEIMIKLYSVEGKYVKGNKKIISMSL
jgi:hypothetical protein